jgi:hypothetical protein
MIESTNALSLGEFVQAGWQLGHLNAADHAGSGPFDQLRLNVSSSAVARMMVCITDFSLWFSLPLSIWLTAGWIGLIVHWQAVLKNGLPEGNMSLKGSPIFCNLFPLSGTDVHAGKKVGLERDGRSADRADRTVGKQG